MYNFKTIIFFSLKFTSIFVHMCLSLLSSTVTLLEKKNKEILKSIRCNEVSSQKLLFYKNKVVLLI